MRACHALNPNLTAESKHQEREAAALARLLGEGASPGVTVAVSKVERMCLRMQKHYALMMAGLAELRSRLAAGAGGGGGGQQ